MSDMSTPDSTKRTYSLPVMVFTFFLLYIFQGLFFGYIQTISLLLKEQNFSYAQMSLLNFVPVPFYLKCFFSPFLDIKYSARIGKRMTYITSFSLLAAACYLFIASYVNTWIDQRQISTLSIVLILTTFIIAIQDLAIDALAEEIFIRRDVKFGPITQSLGQIVGPLISFNFFLYMSDKVPDLNVKFLIILSVFTIITTLLVFFYIHESPTPNEFSSVLQIVKVFPKFLQNSHIRMYLIFLITSSIPTMFFRTCSSLILLDKGLDKQDISMLSLPSLISAIICSSLASSLKMTIKSTLRTMRLLNLANLLCIGISFWVIVRFDKDTNYTSTMNWLYFLSILEGISYVDFVVRSNFNNLICDNRLSCTFLAVMNSMNNFARMSITPLFTLLLGVFSFKSLGTFFFSYALFYLVFIYKKFVLYFDVATKDDFKLKGIETDAQEKDQKEKTD
jgi:PAT family acetyl-CoA transporter-like MFS transporter 1